MKPIKELIKDIIKDHEEIYSLVCKVDKVDLDNRTCDVTPLDGSAEVFDVRLQADEAASTGLMTIPKLETNVIVTFYNRNQAYLALVTEAEEIHLNGSENGGLIIIQNLVDKINNLEKAHNGLVTSFNTHTHAVAGAATAVPNSPSTNTVITTQKSDLENDVILH